MTEPAAPDAAARELDPGLADLAEAFRAGEERALARAISAVEDERPGFEALLDALHEGVGRARRAGITGPPGAGKSTLTSVLARLHRDAGRRVGIIAADPTSPFSGGALLGDRIRMSRLATEPGIFIRSMASRGTLGGLAAATREAADLMDAFGFDRILLETVGVGQGELEVARSADTTVVVLVPESGDGIQAMKAGLMEVADLFVVNKADRPGADRLCKEIRVMKKLRAGRTRGLGAGHHGAAAAAQADDSSDGGTAAGGDGAREGSTGGAADEGAADAPPGTGHDRDGGGWDPPVLQTVASEGGGVEAVAEAVDDHFRWLEESGELEARRREQLLEQARAVVLRRLERRGRALWEERSGQFADALARREVTPYQVADAIAGDAGGEGPGG